MLIIFWIDTHSNIFVLPFSIFFESIDNALSRISHRLRATGERELPSRLVGEEVMIELRNLDGIAYVRFASVYRDFQDVKEFQTEIQKLNKELD